RPPPTPPLPLPDALPLCVPATHLLPRSPPSQPSCNASWKSAPTPQSTCSVSLDQKPSCITYTAIRRSPRLVCVYHAPRRQSGRSDRKSTRLNSSHEWISY